MLVIGLLLLQVVQAQGARSVTVVELGASVVILVLAILAVAWVAGRIYKVGILMSGKRPTIPEIIRWVREA